MQSSAAYDEVIEALLTIVQFYYGSSLLRVSDLPPAAS